MRRDRDIRPCMSEHVDRDDPPRVVCQRYDLTIICGGPGAWQSSLATGSRAKAATP